MLNFCFIQKVWDIERYLLLKNESFCSKSNKAFLGLTIFNKELILVAGLDIQIYDSHLNLIEDFSRKTKENSIKYLIRAKNNKFIISTNNDLELYELYENKNDEKKSFDELLDGVSQLCESQVLIKAHQRHVNAHIDTILFIDNLTGYLYRFYITEKFPN